MRCPSNHVTLDQMINEVGRRLLPNEWTGTEIDPERGPPPVTCKAEPPTQSDFMYCALRMTAKARYRVYHRSRDDSHSVWIAGRWIEFPDVNAAQAAWTAELSRLNEQRAADLPRRQRFERACDFILSKLDCGALTAAFHFTDWGSIFDVPENHWRSEQGLRDLEILGRNCTYVFGGHRYKGQFVLPVARLEFLLSAIEDLPRAVAQTDRPEVPAGPTSEIDAQVRKALSEIPAGYGKRKAAKAVCANVAGAKRDAVEGMIKAEFPSIANDGRGRPKARAG